MSHLILAACGLLTQAEAARDNAESFASDRVRTMRADIANLATVTAKVADLESKNDDLQKKLEAAERKLKEADEKRATDLVMAAQRDGRIAPKDDKTSGFYKRLIAAGDAEAEAALAAMPKLNPGITTPIAVDAGDKPDSAAGGGNGSASHAFVVEARRMVAAGEAKTEGEAYSVLARQKPDLYKSYQTQFAG